MVSVTVDPKILHGRIDREGRLVAADPALEQLQCEAGSAIGQSLALPRIAAVARLALQLGAPVSRSAKAAASDRDFEFWVTATPDGDEIALTLEPTDVRQPQPSRLPDPAAPIAALTAGDAAGLARQMRWACDAHLVITQVSAPFARQLGLEPVAVRGLALTRLLQLNEDEDGMLPLLNALGARSDFSGQHAQARGDPQISLILDGRAITNKDGGFGGYEGTAQFTGITRRQPAPGASTDPELDRILRAPLDRIVANAQHLTGRDDGPLRSDYASYGSDIAAAAKHLLSVLEVMGGAPFEKGAEPVDLPSLVAEAVMMVEPQAEERSIALAVADTTGLSARGDERAIIQILVNILGNAIRHSPAGGTVWVQFAGHDAPAVTISDEGPGIAVEDQERIFGQFEQGSNASGETGLGLAIARRLARAMGGAITVESAPGQGARFTLSLPGA